MNRIDRMELQGLALDTPVGPARVARALLSGVDVQAGLDAVAIDTVELEGVTIAIDASAAARVAGAAWRCEPAAGTEGELRAYITDAAWVLDADVTMPVERGRIDFNRVTVEHIGPDSAMGIGRSGLHVDAPNGRTPLFLWSTPDVPGARPEQRGSMLGQIVDRGALELRPFIEALLAGVMPGRPAAGARELLTRTRLGGHLRLGDGSVGNARQGLVLAGQHEGRNRVELSSMPSGQGFGLQILDLAAADLRAEFAGHVATAATVRGALALHLRDPAGQPSIAAQAARLTLGRVVLRRPDAARG